MLLFVDADNVVLVRQYRYVFGENQRWEMATGGIKPGESAEAAALRELQEEVGYTAQRLEHVSTYYTSKSICYEIAHLYLGYGLQRAILPPDETEFFEVATFSFDDVMAMVERSGIRDGMTVIAVLHAARLRGWR